MSREFNSSTQKLVEAVSSSSEATVSLGQGEDLRVISGQSLVMISRQDGSVRATFERSLPNGTVVATQ